ncbi:hypothetical protein [Phenylobacterium sp.]|uniref:hypothetical protein n=1 Tax=Phenylobacterium sp. TaxID=1871053 RepID=UPI00398384F2
MFNGADAPITLHVDPDLGVGGPKKIRIPAGEAGWFQEARLPTTIDGQRILRVSSEGCSYGFVFPDTNDVMRAPGETFETQYPGSLLLQISPTFTIYVAPPGQAVVGAEADLLRATRNGRPLQRGGFPLRPAAKTCAPNAR